MLANLRSRVNQMASTLNMSNFSNRDSLLGPEGKPDAMARTVGMDNNGLVGFQRQLMKGHLMRLLENKSVSVCSLDLIILCCSSRTRRGPWAIGRDYSKHKTYCFGSEWRAGSTHQTHCTFPLCINFHSCFLWQFCSLLTSKIESFFLICQDGLDQHVDVTDSRLRVTLLVTLLGQMPRLIISKLNYVIIEIYLQLNLNICVVKTESAEELSSFK